MRKYANVCIDKLKPYERNARTHSAEQIEKIANSIKEFGLINPVLIDGDFGIIAGHGRVEGAKKLGMTEVPCLFVEDLTEEQKRAYIIADNKLAEDAGWDTVLLKLELGELADLDFDISLTGFSLDDLDELSDEPKEVTEDEAPEVDEVNEPITQLGDIWQLGDHRLMCGDSTDKATVEKLMDSKNADLVFTDPPYGMKKEKDGVANDNLNYDDLLVFNKQWIPLTFDALKENGSWYCWGIDEPLMDIYSEILKPMIRENKITFRNLITWDKGSGQGQLSSEFRMYPIADEKCLFVMRGIQCLTLNADNYWEEYEPIRKYLYDSRVAMGWDVPTMKKIVGHSDLSRDHWTSKSQFSMPTKKVYDKLKTAAERQRKELGIENDAFRREYDDLRAYFDNTHDNMNNVWHFSKTSGEERETAGGHATPKPIALCSRAIKSSSREGEIVLDVFGGSGSTLIACEQLNRKAYLVELEPRWCDVIIKRWETLTGKKAVKIND